MNYELAKELKEAGFPQRNHQWALDDIKEHPVREEIYLREFGVKSMDEVVYYPTLSELIRACGSEIRLQSYYSENDLMWQADNSFNFLVRDNQIAEVGSTPEEAVARLWLALNKK